MHGRNIIITLFVCCLFADGVSAQSRPSFPIPTQAVTSIPSPSPSPAYSPTPNCSTQEAEAADECDANDKDRMQTCNLMFQGYQFTCGDEYLECIEGECKYDPWPASYICRKTCEKVQKYCFAAASKRMNDCTLASLKQLAQCLKDHIKCMSVPK